MMRLALSRFLTITLIILLVSCSKKGGGSNPPPPEPQEANLVLTTDPANNAVVPPALGPYSVKVNITSAMPPNGVKIEVRARKDDGSGAPSFFTYTNNSNSANNTVAITG